MSEFDVNQNIWHKEEDVTIKSVRNKLFKIEEELEVKPKKRHEEELIVIQSIFSDDKCEVYSEGHLDIECIFEINPILPRSEFRVSYIYHESNEPLDFGSIFISFLTPIHFSLKLPQNYPLRAPPDYSISIPWLPPWESSKVCQRLDQLWEANQGNEIIFIWIDFLKNVLDFLMMEKEIDLSFLYAYSRRRNDFFYSQIIKMKDNRVSPPVKKCPIQLIENFDGKRRKLKFENSVHFCGICLYKYSGRECVKLKNCQDVFCKKCLEEYLHSKINQGIVTFIPCPQTGCSSHLEYQEIKEIARKEVFERFEYILLKRFLDMNKDVFTCPRKLCQYPAAFREDPDDNLMTCANCAYNFCFYCQKVYHGVSPCAMSSEEITKLIEEYQKASKEQKHLLQLKYGKKQIETIVERYLTQEYLKENAKPCPNCYTQITKTEGCNKMTCPYCLKHFCWLCGSLIEDTDPYQHFQPSIDKNHVNICGGKLFDGVLPYFDLFEDIDIEANFQYFQNQD